MTFRTSLRWGIGIAALGQALLLGTYYLATCGAMSSMTGSWIEPPCELPKSMVTAARTALPAVLTLDRAIYRPGADVVESVGLSDLPYRHDALRIPWPATMAFVGLSVAVLNGLLWGAVLHALARAGAWLRGRTRSPRVAAG